MVFLGELKSCLLSKLHYPLFISLFFFIHVFKSPFFIWIFFLIVSINWRNCHQVKIKSRLMRTFFVLLLPWSLVDLHLNRANILTCKAGWISHQTYMFSHKRCLKYKRTPSRCWDWPIMNTVLNFLQIENQTCLHCMIHITAPPD